MLIISTHFLQDQQQCSPVKGKLGEKFQEAWTGELGKVKHKYTKEVYRGKSKDKKPVRNTGRLAL